MARIRTIKPEFFTSLTIDKLSLTAQRTFVGLWTYVDDEGRGLDDARLIKAAVWPLRDKHTVARVATDLDELERLGLVLRYSRNGERILQVRSWKEHQRINRPSVSKYPPFNEGSVSPHAPLPDDSLPERKGKEQGTGNGKEKPPNPLPEGERVNPRANGTNPRAVAERERKTAADARQARIDACEACDENGWIHPNNGASFRCSHASQAEVVT